MLRQRNSLNDSQQELIFSILIFQVVTLTSTTTTTALSTSRAHQEGANPVLSYINKLKLVRAMLGLAK